MKKVFILVVVLSLALMGTASAAIVNSSHDLSVGSQGALGSDPTGAGTGQVCVFCHHPHRGEDAALGTALLWNMSDQQKTAYVTYTSTTMNAAATSDVDNTAPQSFLCMACHDGLIAAGALVRAPKDGSQSSTDANLGTAADLVGATDLQDDHPVNINYETDTDANLQAADGPDSVTGAVTSTKYPLFASIMHCATCHDVHKGTDSADPNIQFMRATTAASAICVDCHINK